MSKSLTKKILKSHPELLYATRSTEAGASDRHPQNSELVLIAGGTGKIEYGDESTSFAAGDLFLINKGASLHFVMDAVSDREMLAVGIGNLHLFAHAPDNLLEDRDWYLMPAGETFAPLCDCMRRTVTELADRQPMYETINENLIKVILLYAVRLIYRDGSVPFGESAEYIRAKRYFDEHFLEIDSVDAVCKELDINKYYLAHLFTQNTGMPPIHYIITKRIERACHFLETTDMNVGDVGKECGYHDPCYFSRMFKLVKKVTPLRYRFLFKAERAEQEKKEKEQAEQQERA